MFSSEYLQELDKISSRYEDKKAALLPILHFIQEKEGFISPEAEANISAYIGVAVVHIHEVVSFYHLFNQKKKGKCQFAVCQTTACALRGAEELIKHMSQRLGIKPGETTTDGKFSLTAVECLGACEIAPMMQLNKDYVGNLNKKMIDEIIDSHK